MALDVYISSTAHHSFTASKESDTQIVRMATLERSALHCRLSGHAQQWAVPVGHVRVRAGEVPPAVHSVQGKFGTLLHIWRSDSCQWQ